jgi:uncharacterized iron-regulated membrane protein
MQSFFPSSSISQALLASYLHQTVRLFRLSILLRLSSSPRVLLLRLGHMHAIGGFVMMLFVVLLLRLGLSGEGYVG